MDISTALALIGQATGLVKDLREIDKSFDSAAVKAKMADLYSTLADVKIALSDAREEIHQKEQKINELEGRVAALTSGEACPLCDGGQMKVTKSHPHPQFGVFGTQERTLTCMKCGHSEPRLFDANGRPKRK